MWEVGGWAQEGFRSQNGHHGRFVQDGVSLVHTLGHKREGAVIDDSQGPVFTEFK